MTTSLGDGFKIHHLPQCFIMFLMVLSYHHFTLQTLNFHESTWFELKKTNNTGLLQYSVRINLYISDPLTYI